MNKEEEGGEAMAVFGEVGVLHRFGELSVLPPGTRQVSL